MFHVQKFEISPHDRFFLHGPGPSARDKYEVCALQWSHDAWMYIVHCASQWSVFLAMHCHTSYLSFFLHGHYFWLNFSPHKIDFATKLRKSPNKKQIFHQNSVKCNIICTQNEGDFRFLYIFMFRNLKLIHMWRNFSFLHMFHVQKFEISPHDRFFLHGPGPSARDKYEVCALQWSHDAWMYIVHCASQWSVFLAMHCHTSYLSFFLHGHYFWLNFSPHNSA